MDPIMVVVWAIVLMCVLIALEMPAAFAVAVSGSLAVILLQGTGTLLYTLGAFPVSRVATYSWSALPLYILLGNLIAASGVGVDAYEAAYRWFGKVKGGLLVATTVASGLVAATTGSGATSITIMGRIAMPEMERLGYDRSLAAGTVCSCGPLGTLIPPSMAFVIIGILAEVSIGKLFIAGIIPGIISVALFSIMLSVRCTLNPTLAPVGVSFSWKERFASLPKLWGVVIIFVVIIGGLYTGIATATEVASIGCLAAFIMVFMGIASKKSSWKQLWEAITETIGITAMIAAFIFGAGILGLAVTLSGITQAAANFILSAHVPYLVIIFIMVVVYFIMGMFVDPMSTLMITVPIFYPILVKGLGMDPVWLSVFIVVNVEIGSLTPPIGMALFTMHAVYPRASLVEITRGMLWFIVMNFVVIALMVAFPQINTWLPSVMWK